VLRAWPYPTDKALTHILGLLCNQVLVILCLTSTDVYVWLEFRHAQGVGISAVFARTKDVLQRRTFTLGFEKLETGTEFKGRLSHLNLLWYPPFD
jgi:hypothetical protein